MFINVSRKSFCRRTKWCRLFCWSTLIAACLVFSSNLIAQEPIAESNADSATTNGAIPVFTLSESLTKKIDLNLTFSYVGGQRGKGLLVEIPFKLNKYFTVAPSYAYLAAPMMNRRYHENQLRVAVTATLPRKRFTLDDRNMFERRIRAGFDDATRYHNRLRIRYPLKFKKFNFDVVAYNEATYDWSVSRWDRNRAAAGLSKTFAERLTTEIYYLRQDNRQGGDANFAFISVTLRDSSLSKLFKRN